MPSNPANTRRSLSSHSLPPDHPVLVSLAKSNSIFYRGPKPPPLPSAQPTQLMQPTQTTSRSLPLPERHTNTSEQSGEDGLPHSFSSNSAGNGMSSMDAAAIAEAEASLRYTLCQALPYWHCYLTRDTHEFLWTSSPAMATRPVTVKAEPVTLGPTSSNYIPPTPELVMSIVENLRMSYRSDICQAVIPFERRLPNIRDFIWRLFDGTKVDMWTGLACLILLKRFRQEQPPCDDAPYEAPYSLFLGVFMLAAEQCVRTDNPELFTLPSISRILDTWYQPADLIRIRLETFIQTGHRAWISKKDVTDHAAHNIFDIHNMQSSHLHFEERQRLRMLVEEEERRLEENRQRLLARLERYMYRTPHDSNGSWNSKTMYCTESRFLFRHLPWFTGVIPPIHVTARSEEARSGDQTFRPVFSPLIPALRTRVSSSTN